MPANRGNLVDRTTGFGEPAALRLAQTVRGAMRQTCFIAPSAKSPTEARRAEWCASFCGQKCQVLCWSVRQDCGQRWMNRDVQRGAGGAGSLARAHSNGSVSDMLRSQGHDVATAQRRIEHQGHRHPRPRPDRVLRLVSGDIFLAPSCEPPRYSAAIPAIERGRLTAATPEKTRGIERAPRDHSPTGDRREKRLFSHLQAKCL